MRQAAEKSLKKADSLITNVSLTHQAVRSTGDHELPRTIGDGILSGGQDFSQMPNGHESVTQSCGFTPQRCPFGGACHTCPPRVQAKSAGGIQRKAVNNSRLHDIPPIVHEVLRSPGEPLPKETLAFFEPRFRRDFGHVRVHTDARASESAKVVNALAYTVGRDVVFGAGQFAPVAARGKDLIAHELTHVVQQEGKSRDGTTHSIQIDSETASESEAQRIVQQIAGGAPDGKAIDGVAPVRGGRERLQRQEDESAETTPKVTESQEGGVPVLNRGRGLGGSPPPPGCLEFLWAREYDRIFRLDTISVIGVSARPASDKKEDVEEAQRSNAKQQQILIEACSKYEHVKHPFRVRFYYLETDLRDPVGTAIQTADSKRNRELGERLGAGLEPKLVLYVERDEELRERFPSSAKALDGKVSAVVQRASTSGAKKGAKVGAIVGGVLGVLAGVAVGILAGMALAAGGVGLGLAIAGGIGAGVLAGGLVTLIGAGLGALAGHAFGTDRGTAALSKERIKQVQSFVGVLRATGEVKGKVLTSSEVDVLARDAVTLWIDDPVALPLAVHDRRLLIRVMLKGAVFDDDERAIIKILQNSTDSEVLEILSTSADEKERVTLQNLDDSIHGAEWQETKKMLRSRFPTLGAPEIERKESGSEFGSCNAEQAITIVEARKRAAQIVPIASQRLADHIATPSPEVTSLIQCYFPFARQADVVRVKSVFDRIQQLIPSSRYNCPGQKELHVPTPVGPASEQCSRDMPAFTVVWSQDGSFHARNETFLCPVFFDTSPEDQVITVIHEWVHRAMPETEIDFYVPKCNDLTKDRALVNPDSYAFLAYKLGRGRLATAAGLPSVTVGDFRNKGQVTPENRCPSCTQIPTLGVDPGSGANFMELRGDISGNQPDAFYDFKRTREVAVWKQIDGDWKRDKYDPPGTPDDKDANDEDPAPKNDRIYAIDGPGIHVPFPMSGGQPVNALVYKGNFVETVNVRVGSGAWKPGSNAFRWHSITWIERRNGVLKRVGRNEIEPGHTLIDPGNPAGPGDYPMPAKGVQYA